jgi:hypothetical protein
MGVRLMVEVLDHYHGPPRYKLWLLAFAESARDSTRRGWAPRYKLAHRAGVSGTRASHVAAELVAEGVVKRHGGGYHGQTAEYELLPLAPLKGAPRPHPSKGADTAPKGALGDAKGAPRAHPTPHTPHNPSGGPPASPLAGGRAAPGAPVSDGSVEVMGTCPRCGRITEVTDGRAPPHNGKDGQPCPGSGEPADTTEPPYGWGDALSTQAETDEARAWLDARTGEDR